MTMKKETQKIIIEVLETLLGAFIIAIAVSLFLLPNELSSGGFAGIGTILYYLFHFPVGITIIVLNVPLFILATFKIGKRFLIKSLIGTLSLSVFIDLLDKLTPLTNDKILACLYGGILTGVGTALILRAHSSTGGSDLAGNIIKEYKPMARTGNLIMIIDSVIVILNVIFLKKVEIALYSAITIYLMGKIIDIVFEGAEFTKLVFIISDKSDKISDVIVNEVKRGVTGIDGKGMYTDKKKLVLMCAVGRRELPELKSKIKEIDPNAFLIITNSREVLGTGFKE